MSVDATRAADHATVVGGSGMLAGLCHRLAADGWQVTVVGRDRSKLARACADARLHPLSVDYEDVGNFAAALAKAAAARGPIVLAVCWIRSWAPLSLLATADAVATDGRLVQVLGSQASGATSTAIAALAARRGLDYRQVQLGAMGDGPSQRWLTDSEISAGVDTAIGGDRPFHLVGRAPG